MEKFSWNKFIIGICKLIFSKESFVWITATLFVYKAVFNGLSDTIKLHFIIIWGVISIAFFFSHAFSKFIENGKLEVKAEASANVGRGAA